MKQMPPHPKIKRCQRAHSHPSIIFEGANSASFQGGNKSIKTATSLTDRICSLEIWPLDRSNFWTSNMNQMRSFFTPSFFPFFGGVLKHGKNKNHCFETTTGTCLLSNYRSFVCFRLWHGCSYLRPRLPAVEPSKLQIFRGEKSGCFRDGNVLGWWFSRISICSAMLGMAVLCRPPCVSSNFFGTSGLWITEQKRGHVFALHQRTTNFFQRFWVIARSFFSVRLLPQSTREESTCKFSVAAWAPVVAHHFEKQTTTCTGQKHKHPDISDILQHVNNLILKKYILILIL